MKERVQGSREKYRYFLIGSIVFLLAGLLFISMYENDADSENEMAGFNMLSDEFGSSSSVIFDDDKNRYIVQTYSEEMFDAHIDAMYGDPYASAEWSALDTEMSRLSYQLLSILEKEGYEIFLSNPMSDSEPFMIAKDGEVTFDIVYN